MKRFRFLFSCRFPLIAVLTFLVLLSFLFVSSKYEVQRSLESKISSLSFKLTEALQKKNPISIQKLGDSIASDKIELLRIESDSGTFYSFPSEIKSTSCMMPVNYHVTYYGVRSGSIHACLSSSKILISSLSSPFFLFGVVIFGLFSMIPLLSYRKTLQELLANAEKWSVSPESQIHPLLGQDEIGRQIIEHFEIGIKNRNLINQQKNDLEQKEKLNQFARRVAHDCNSSLVGLETLLQMLGDGETPNEEMMDIAKKTSVDLGYLVQDLGTLKIGESKKQALNEVSSAEELSSIMLSEIVEGITTLKLHELNSIDKKINISIEYHDLSQTAFVLADEKNLRRNLSNLLNNSIEAIDSRGHICISIRKLSDFFQIAIVDNGHGISQEDLEDIGKMGNTTKAHGSGMGVFNAKSDIRGWGGKLKIESDGIGLGTTVLMNLKVGKTPAWMVNSIDIPKSTPVSVLDDDKNIHKTWERILGSGNYSGEAKFYERAIDAPQDSNCLWFVDFDLGIENRGSEIANGLDFIEKHRIENSCLVTANYQDFEIQQQAKNLNIRILPKFLLNKGVVRISEAV